MFDIIQVNGLQCNIAHHNPSPYDRYKLPDFYFLLNSVGIVAFVRRPSVLKWLYNLKTVGFVPLGVAGWYEWQAMVAAWFGRQQYRLATKEALAAGTLRSVKMLSPRNQMNGAVKSICFDVFCVVNLYTMARTAMVI